MSKNELVVRGNQKFMGKEIPVVFGGFGEGKKCVSDKTVAEIHEMEIKHVRELLNRNVTRFKENVDFIDLKVVVQNDDNLLSVLGYSKMQISKAEHIYILSERGYAKLIKIMDTDLAWEIHDKLMDDYFLLRDGKTTCIEDILIESLQEMKSIRMKVDTNSEDINKLESKVDSIKDVIALRPNAWRKDTGVIINKIAYGLGDPEHIRVVREESYKILEERMHVSLSIRLTNKKKTYALNNVCKSKNRQIEPVRCYFR